MGIFEFKNLKKFFYWTIIILLFSILGYIAYIVFANNLKFKAKQQIINKRKSTKNYLYKAGINVSNPKLNNKISNYIYNNLKSNIWQNNKVEIYTNGKDFLLDLLKNIDHAKNHIHLEFFIFSDDFTGKQISNALIQKAKQGISIKIIYDAFGSRKTKSKFWKNLKKYGIEVEAFFPAPFGINLLNLKINYRNHRKIAIIDGKIAYTGGINIRNDHMGKSKRLFPWRDTQIKLTGTGVYALQDIFLNDWFFCSKSTYLQNELYNYFPTTNINGNISLQIIDDGPDYDEKRILSTYIKIINDSQKYIYIQSPYFLITDEFTQAILNAKKRGVYICIFVPKKPDKKLVYGASLINLKTIFENGIDIFLYKGFIHSKTLLTEKIACIGSCNFDYRSFFLNFEITCIIYNKRFNTKYLKVIKNDVKNSILLTNKLYFKLKSHNFIMILIYKLLSKIF